MATGAAGPCCAKRTPFQLALILVLFIASLFLIALVIICILYGVIWKKTLDCEKDVCTHQHEGRSYPFEEIERKRRAVQHAADSIQNMSFPEAVDDYTKEPIDCQQYIPIPYPFAAALIEDLYEDVRGEKVLACIVTLLSNTTALTTSDCIDMRKFKRYAIRAGSSTWSENGFLMRIKGIKVFDSNNNRQSHYPVILRLEGFPEEVCMSFANLSRTNTLLESSEAFGFTWSSSFNLPLAQRFRYSQLQKVKVNLHPRDCPQLSENNSSHVVCGGRDENSTSCGNTISGPLVDDNGIIIALTAAIHCDKGVNQEYTYYEDISNYAEWIGNVLKS